MGLIYPRPTPATSSFNRFSNIISANGGVGLALSGSNNLVQGNFIGTDVTGTITDPDGIPANGDELGNRGYGITSCDGPGCVGSANITIGGTAAGARNVISGNGLGGQFTDGVQVAIPGSIVQGNFIGTDVSGTLARGNVGNGVRAATGSLIGGTVAGARNVISANGANGVFTGCTDNVSVQGNYIGLQADGVSPLGNAQHGVWSICGGPSASLVGGTASGARNRIAFNGGNGVLSQGGGQRTTILGNSIFSNSLLGIDVVDVNDNQAAPVLTSAISGSSTTIQGTLASSASTSVTLEFFSNSACDPSGSGEGETFIGRTAKTTDANGNLSFTVSLPVAVPAGKFITATATHPNGNTSKFSGCKVAVNAYSISGQVKVGTTGLAGVTMTLTSPTPAGFTPRTVLTNSTGGYSFTNVPGGRSYILRPSKTNYTFTPTSKSYSNLAANQTNQNFAATLKKYTISGVVKLGAAGLSGVSMKLTSPTPAGFTPITVTTSSTGAYSFTNVPAGRNYTVTPSKTGYQFTPTSKSLTNLSANQTGVNFAVKVYSISGRVIKAGTTTGISGVTMTLTSPTPAGFAARTVMTSSTGVYTFTNLPAGRSYTIKPTKSGFTFNPVTRSFTNLSANQPVGPATSFTGTPTTAALSGEKYGNVVATGTVVAFGWQPLRILLAELNSGELYKAEVFERATGQKILVRPSRFDDTISYFRPLPF